MLFRSIERNITTEKTGKTNVQAEKQINQSEESEKTDNSSKNIDKKTETKTLTKSKTPAWIIVTMVILSMGVLVLLYFVLKRFKLIK